MEKLLEATRFLFPDGIIYLLIAIVLVTGLIKCSRPVRRNASALRQATRLLRDGAKAKLSKPVWSEQGFLGKRLQPVWRAYLQNAQLGASSGVSSDVAEYVNDDVIITEPGKAALADLIPNLCTSLGILGTFVGLVMGLSGLDVMDPDSYTRLTSGISLAFTTSIVGIIAAVLFNVINRYSVGQAQNALDAFVSAFYAHAIARPPDAATQLLTYEREQAEAMNTFANDLSVRIGVEIREAIAEAMDPVRRTMNDFINAATRAQVDGLDYIVARFIDRMNQTLGGELEQLRQALAETSQSQLQTQEKLRGVVDSVGDMTENIVEIHGVSEQLISRFSAYVGDMGAAYREISENQADASDVLQEISEASLRQSKYLSALQEYQAQLQQNFQDYTIWTDRLVTGLQEHTDAQASSLGEVAAEMRGSGKQLSSAYKDFSQAVELGLTNSLRLFEDSTQGMLLQMQATLEDIRASMQRLQAAIGREVN